MTSSGPALRLESRVEGKSIVRFISLRRHYRYEQKLARLLWKVDHKEIIEFPADGINSNSSFEMKMTIQTPGASVRLTF